MARKTKSEVAKSNRKVKPATRYKLWAINAGRCVFCNRSVYAESTFGMDGNFGELAHIHAVGTMGPRHVPDMTEEDLNDATNLMLLCQEHHKMIDDNPDIFPGEYLWGKKLAHETRIRKVTEVGDLVTCRLVSYCTTIDNNEIPVHEHELKRAIIKDGLVPGYDRCINLAAITHRNERTSSRYAQKASDLVHAVKQKLEDIVEPKECIAIFAIAPMPLLMKLGTLINDQYHTRVFQKHRTGYEWAWKDDNATVEYNVYGLDELKPGHKQVAVNISLSASINNARISPITGNTVPIITFTIDSPNREFVTNESIANKFVSSYRDMIENIKHKCAPEQILLFPAMPASLAVRLGQDYMFKTDPPIIIYDEDQSVFVETITIGGENI